MNKRSESCKAAGVGKWMKGRRSPNWKGGRITLVGYYYVLTKDHPHPNKRGYVPEHRLVIEKALGEYLPKGAVCHHINSKKKDNRLENLMAFKTHSAHMRYEQGGKVKKGEILWPIN